jgi:predicted Zn-dependent protease
VSLPRSAPQSAQTLVDRALEISRSEECMVLVDEVASANLRWADNSLTTNGVTRTRTVTVVALARAGEGTAAGVVSRTGVEDDSLAELVAAADEAARQAPPAEEAMPLLTAQDAARGGDFDAGPDTTGVAVFTDFAADLGEAFAEARSLKRRLYGYAEHEVRTTYLGSSSGLRLRHDQPCGTVQINAKDPHTGSSTWVGRHTRDFGDVDTAALAREVHRRSEWAERRVELPAGRYETLLPPAAVADLMIDLYNAAGARDAAEGRTVFSGGQGGTRIGERLSPLPLTLRSDPAEPGLECAPFVLAGSTGRESTAFDNGLGLASTEWISGGRLAALGQTRHSAGLTGLALTPLVDNLILEQPGSATTLEDMVASTERGLLLTCLWYIRVVDPQTLLLTGLTRDGVYLVEGGEITAAVNNFRFNESPVDLLQRAQEVGRTAPALSRESGDFFPRTAMPPLRVGDFNMSSVSQAS